MCSPAAVSANAFRLSNPKLLSLRAAAARRAALRRAGGKLVLTNGVFDLLHPGHTSLLERARRLAGTKGLVFVALNSDRSVRKLKGPLRPVLDEASRAYNLAQLRTVDGIVIFNTQRLTREIEALRPDIYVKGGDYAPGTLNTEEKAALVKVGARIRLAPVLAGFSTTSLIKKIRRAGKI